MTADFRLYLKLLAKIPFLFGILNKTNENCAFVSYN